MASYSIRQDVKVEQSLDAQVATADKTGDSIDTLGYESVLVLYHFGVSGDTLSSTVKIEGVLQESEDNSSWSDVDSDDIDGTLPTVDAAADDEATYAVGYLGSKRYVRPKFDFSGTHANGTEVASDVILANPKEAPAS